MARAQISVLLVIVAVISEISGLQHAWELSREISEGPRRVNRAADPHHGHRHRYRNPVATTGSNCVCDKDLDLLLGEMARLQRELQKANMMLEQATSTAQPPPTDGTDQLEPILLRSGSGHRNATVESLLSALKADNEAQASEILTSLPASYQEAPQNILQAALRIPEVVVSQVAQLLRFMTSSKPIYTLVDYSSLAIEPENVTSVGDLKNIIMGLTKAAETSPGRAASKQSEESLLHKTMQSLVRTAQTPEDWNDVNSWLGNDFFNIFRKLSKRDVLDEVVGTLKSASVGDFNEGQLKFLEARYYDCADSYGAILPGSELKEHYFNFARCNQVLKGLPGLKESIEANLKKAPSAEQMLDESMAWVFATYPTNSKDGQLIRPYPYIVNDENLWLAYNLDAIMAAVENGTVSCKLTCIAELLETLDPLVNGLSKYKFFTDLVTRNVQSHFKSSPNDIEPIMEYVERLPYSLGKLGMTTLLSLMQEGNIVSNLKGQTPILLAHQMLSFDLQNETLWNEIPQLARNLAGMTNKTAVQWKVKIGDEVWEIYGKGDNTLGIVKPEEKGGQLWVFEVKYEEDGAVFFVYLIDTKEEKFGRVHYHRGGDLRHELKARPYGNYGFKIELNESGDGFSLRYKDAEEPVCVVRDEDGKPLKLGACRKEKEVANFVVQKSREKRDALLKKLFK